MVLDSTPLQNAHVIIEQFMATLGAIAVETAEQKDVNVSKIIKNAIVDVITRDLFVTKMKFCTLIGN